MRVLVVHNRYVSTAPSGENLMVDAEVELLRKNGVDVEVYQRSSDEIDSSRTMPKIMAGAPPLYSPRSINEFQAALDRLGPDLIHVHNVFPLIGPSIIHASVNRGTPVVHTVHNYRHSCVNGMHVRDGVRCDDCLSHKVPWPAVAHGCYRGSRMQSIPMAASQVLHRSTWNRVSRFLALTPFMQERLRRAGVPNGKITVRPTWVSDVVCPDEAPAGLLFAGRLDASKGIDQLLRLWTNNRTLATRLTIVGDGPLRPQCILASKEDDRISYVGAKTQAETRSLIGQHSALLLPSMIYEGFPLVVAEALCAARPVIALDGGSVASVITSDIGWLVQPSDESLLATLMEITSESLLTKGRNARRHYEANLSPEAAWSSIKSVYDYVLGGSS